VPLFLSFLLFVIIKLERLQQANSTADPKLALTRLETVPIPQHVAAIAESEMLSFWKGVDEVCIADSYTPGDDGIMITVTHPLIWLLTTLTKLHSLLETVPDQLEISWRPMKAQDVMSLLPPSREISKTLFAAWNDFPTTYCLTENSEFWSKTGRNLPSVRQAANRLGLAAMSMMVTDRLDRAALHRPFDADTPETPTTPIMLAVPVRPAFSQVSIVERNTFFSCFYYYQILFSRNLKFDDFRSKIYRTVLDMETLNPCVLVIDNFFGTNTEQTNKSKLKALCTWHDFLQKRHMVRPPPKSVPPTFLRAWKAAVICIFIQQGHFKNYFLDEFLKAWTQKYSTVKGLLGIIVQLGNLLHRYELSPNAIIKIPHTNPLVKKLKQRDAQDPRASTSIPLAVWFNFLILLFFSNDKGTRVIGTYAILNMLTSSRFNEVLSLQMSQIVIRTNKVSASKEIREVEFLIPNTKTKRQRFIIPVIRKYELFDLEKILLEVSTFLVPNHQRIAETKIFGRLTAGLVNEKLDELWGEYVRRVNTYFPTQQTRLTTHSFRKLAAIFYVEFLGFHPDFVRQLFGHTINSRTLETVYLAKLPSTLRHEQFVSNPHI